MPPLRGPFRFDARTHTYTVGGVVVPGIHAVLRAAGLEEDFGERRGDEYRARGVAVHAATLLYDLGAEPVLREEWQPYLDAYVKFRGEVACRWRLCEQARVNRTLRYATVLDRVGTVSGLPCVFEIKTGYPAASHGPQLAGADLLLPRGVKRRRLAVYLRPGEAQLKEYDDAADYARFIRAVTEFWRE